MQVAWWDAASAIVVSNRGLVAVTALDPEPTNRLGVKPLRLKVRTSIWPLRVGFTR